MADETAIQCAFCDHTVATISSSAGVRQLNVLGGMQIKVLDEKRGALVCEKCGAETAIDLNLLGVV